MGGDVQPALLVSSSHKQTRLAHSTLPKNWVNKKFLGQCQ
jgi:hypothetical protein